MKFYIPTIIFVLTFVFQANAQFGYKKHSEKDGITVFYKWKHSKIFNKNSPLELNLKIKNTNDYTVNSKISVLYYIDGVLNQENNLSFEGLKPVKFYILYMAGIGLYSELSNEQLTSESFTWKLEILEVERDKDIIDEKNKSHGK